MEHKYIPQSRRSKVQEHFGIAAMMKDHSDLLEQNNEDKPIFNINIAIDNYEAMPNPLESDYTSSRFPGGNKRVTFQDNNS